MYFVISVYTMVYILYIKIHFSSKKSFISPYIIIFFNDLVTCFLMFLTSSASIQISDAIKFNMADTVHRLSLAASAHLTGGHFIWKQPIASYRHALRSNAITQKVY